MKIGIISDTHGHEMAWAHACERFFKGADLIVHAGDVLYHGPRNPMKADYNPAGLVARPMRAASSCPSRRRTPTSSGRACASSSRTATPS